MRRTRLSVMPMMRRSPSSRRRSRMDSDIVLMMPMRAITTLISSSPVTALIRKSKTVPMSFPTAFPSCAVMSGRTSARFWMASLVLPCAPEATSTNARVGATSPTRDSKVVVSMMLPV